MKNYRPILPTPSGHSDKRDLPDKVEPVAKKRWAYKRPVLVACNQCRAKKTACDGIRPVCSRCTSNNRACSYDSESMDETRAMALKRRLDKLQQDHKEHAEIIQRLRSAPEAEAFEIVRRLRTTSNVSMVLSSIQGSAHNRSRPSDIQASRGILPPTESGIEFELSMLHHLVYPVLAPLDIASVDVDSFFIPPRRSPHISTSETGRPIGSQTVDEKSYIVPALTIAPPSPLHGILTRRSSPIAGPLPAANYCDPRLSRIETNYWTRIPISNEFTAAVLSHYFENDHTIFGCIDADLFLSDLIDKKLDYCSPFLFSSLLSIACQSYSAIDVRSTAFSVAFIRDAEQLWQSERNSDTVTTLAAMVYLSMACSMSGNDQLTLTLVAASHDMAVRMKLLGAQPTTELHATFQNLPPGKRRGMAAAAWGLYSWLTFHSTYYPTEPIEFPPPFPIPGDSDEIAFGSPTGAWPSYPLPVYMGKTFCALSNLWIIVQEINVVYNLKDSSPLIQRVALAFAESKYQKLLAWADTLTSELQLDENSPGHIFFFHGIYHSTVLSLFRPFCNSSEKSQIRSFSSVDGTPSTIFSASLNQLKRLIYIYCGQLGRLSINGWFNAAVMQVFNAVVKNSAEDPEWYFYFRLCFGFWKGAYTRFPVVYHMVQAILAFAIQTGAITGAEASIMMEELSSVGRHHEAPEATISSALIDLELTMEHPENANIDAIARRFDELVIFDDFVDGNLLDADGSID